MKSSIGEILPKKKIQVESGEITLRVIGTLDLARMAALMRLLVKEAIRQGIIEGPDERELCIGDEVDGCAGGDRGRHRHQAQPPT